MGTFTLTQVHFSEKNGTFTSLLWAMLLSLLHLNAIQVKKMLQFIPNAPSTLLWSMSDAHSQMIHSFESILFKGLIKPVDRPVNRFTNQFECFVQFLSARVEVVVNFKNGRQNIKSIERNGARPVPGGMHLLRHN